MQLGARLIFPFALAATLLATASAVCAEDWNSRARDDMARGDARAAEAHLQQALEVNPFDPVALNNLAVAKAEQGDYHSSLALLERADELAPGNPDIELNLNRMRGWVMTYAGNDISPFSGGEKGHRNMQRSAPPMWR